MPFRYAVSSIMRLAYVTVTFPCLRETFVLREVRHLEERLGQDGFRMYAYQHPVGADVNDDNRSWVAKTSYLKHSIWANLLAMCVWMVTEPRRSWRALKLWMSEVPALDLRTNLQVMVHVLTAFGLAQKIRADKIERMHAHFATASTLALFAHVLTGVPFSFTAHASGDVYVYSPFLFEKLRRSWRVVAISDYNRRYLDLISGYTLPDGKVVTVFNGVELPKLDVGPKHNDVPLLFTSAAFTTFKGYGTLLEVLCRLKRDGIPFRFVAVGGGPLFNVMQARVREFGLSECVSLLGPQPFSEVQKWLARADIFVFPAEIGLNGQRDGMPTAITEALAYGLPVVATHITGVPQQVKDGVNGFLVEERDPEAFATRLRELLDSPEMRLRMGREGRRLAEACFDLRRTLSNLEVALLGPVQSVHPETNSRG